MIATAQFNSRRTSCSLVKLASISALGLLMTSLPAMAQNEAGAGSQTSSPTLMLGLGAYGQQRPYGNSQLSPVPIISFKSRLVELEGATADLNILRPTSAVTLALRARYAIGEGYEASDASILTGMADRDGSVWVGAAVKMQLGRFSLTGDLLKDVLSNSRGWKAKVSGAYALQAGRFLLVPRVSATRISERTADYYFGVRDSEITPTRPAYRAGSSVEFEVGGRVLYPIGGRHRLILDTSIIRRGNSVRRSPLVEDKINAEVGIGYAFQF